MSLAVSTALVAFTLAGTAHAADLVHGPYVGFAVSTGNSHVDGNAIYDPSNLETKGQGATLSIGDRALVGANLVFGGSINLTASSQRAKGTQTWCVSDSCLYSTIQKQQVSTPFSGGAGVFLGLRAGPHMLAGELGGVATQFVTRQQVTYEESGENWSDKTTHYAGGAYYGVRYEGQVNDQTSWFIRGIQQTQTENDYASSNGSSKGGHKGMVVEIGFNHAIGFGR